MSRVSDIGRINAEARMRQQAEFSCVETTADLTSITAALPMHNKTKSSAAVNKSDLTTARSNNPYKVLDAVERRNRQIISQ